MRGAWAVGLGAGVADVVFAALVAFGAEACSDYVAAHGHIIRIAGGLFLIYLAYKELKDSSNTAKAANIQSRNLIGLGVKVFFLTMSNPMAILSFVAIFGTLSSMITSVQSAWTLVAGIFVGSMAWWYLLGRVVNAIKHAIPDLWITRIRYVSCALLAGFGVYSLGLF